MVQRKQHHISEIASAHYISDMASALKQAGTTTLDLVRLQGSLPGMTVIMNGEVEDLTIDKLTVMNDGTMSLLCTGDNVQFTTTAEKLHENELKDLRQHLFEYLDTTKDARGLLERLKALVGKTLPLERIKEALDALSECLGRTVLDGSEGWSPTCCPEDYDDEVFFSDDFCPGVEWPNMEGCNLFELHYSENGTGEDGRLMVTVNSFDYYL